MRRARSAREVTTAGVALIFGALVAIAGPMITLRFPIYTPVCAPCKYEYVIPNVLQVPLFAIVVGGALGLFHASRIGRSGRITAIVRGVSGGLAAALVASLIATATLAFTDPYIGLVYRAYAVAFVFAAMLVVAAVVVRTARADNLGTFTILLAAPTAGALAAAVATTVRGSVTVGAAAFVGALLGAALSGTRPSTWMSAKLRALPATSVLAVVVAIAVALRLVFGIQALVRVGPGMPFALLSDDGPAYYEFAHGLYLDPSTAGAVLSNSSGYPPVYSFFVAAVFWLTRESIAVVVVIQALLAGVSVLLLYVIARHLAGGTVALATAALFAFDQNLIHNQSTLTPEALLVPTILAALYVAVRYQRERSWRLLVILAGLLGLAFATRNLIFVLTLAILGWSSVRQRRAPWRWVRDAAVIVGATVVAATPVILATGAARLTNQAAAVSWGYQSDSGITIENEFLVGRGIDPMSDPGGTLQRVIADPLPVLGFYAGAVPQRISALLFYPNFGSSDPLVLVNPAVYASPFGQIWLMLLVVGLVAGSVRLARSTSGGSRAMLALLVTYVIVYVALFAFVFPPRQAYRYRIPIQPLMQLTEAVGLVWMLRYAVSAWTAERASVALPRRGP